MSKKAFSLPKEAGPWRSLLLFGPPGSGKGTLGGFLSSAGNHYHLSSGDVFRGLSPESEAGKIYHSYASKGKLVPDEVTVEVWRNYTGGLIATNAYFPSEQFLLLDGVPRTANQVELMKPYIEVAHVIVLEVEDVSKLIKRIKRRAIIEKRMDDFDEKVLHHRMEVYQNETSKVLQHLPKERISHFNADQPPLNVLRDVLVELSFMLTHPRDDIPS